MTKTKKIILGILIVAIILIGVPLFLDQVIVGNKISSNISNSEWIGFLGSYLGGILGASATIFGIYIVYNLERFEEKRGLKIYLSDIFRKNTENKEKIIINLFNNLKLKQSSLKFISTKLYEENLLKIYKLKNYNKINELFDLQIELEKKRNEITPYLIETDLIFKEIDLINKFFSNTENTELKKSLKELNKVIFLLNYCLSSKQNNMEIDKKNYYITKFPYTKEIFEAFEEENIEDILDKIFKELLSKATNIVYDLQYEDYQSTSNLMFEIGYTYSYYKLMLKYLKKCEEYKVFI
ncbi:MAG: hypothetical protein WBG30_00765 [Psychrilyobacter sp.]|uniref:hypothetical protein n=1 Tax=Psychrilyobacter sp. TaxID=2586924 RepID=UPI003C718627